MLVLRCGHLMLLSYRKLVPEHPILFRDLIAYMPIHENFPHARNHNAAWFTKLPRGVATRPPSLHLTIIGLKDLAAM